MTSKYELEKLINFVICVNKQLRGLFRPIILETLIMRYGLKGKGRTRPDFFRVVHAHNFTHVRPRSKNFWSKWAQNFLET